MLGCVSGLGVTQILSLCDRFESSNKRSTKLENLMKRTRLQNIISASMPGFKFRFAGSDLVALVLICGAIATAALVLLT